VCTGYTRDGDLLDRAPVGAYALADCPRIYDDSDGWNSSTVGISEYDQLPAAAKAYLARVEELVETPVAIVSTGPDRKHTIVLEHPLGG
ncbi:adenylosuccinate synthase, partial [bacterium]|nr:adenylosuccinate synthase [bacterium]